MLIHCSEIHSLIFVVRHRNAHLTSTATSTQLVLMCLNFNWCKLKHAYTCLYYDQVA